MGGSMSARQPEPIWWPVCDGPCEQGRNACPTPEACHLVDTSGLRGNLGGGSTPPQRRTLQHDEDGPSVVLVALCCVIAAAVMLAAWLST
jgi:hypothetical protein